MNNQNIEVKEPTQNQLSSFVYREVGNCQSYLVEELLKKNIFSYDDIINLYSDNQNEINELKNQLDEIKGDLKSNTSEDDLTTIAENERKADELESKIEELEQEQSEPQEIFEWWLVSDFMAKKLEDQKEPILKNDYGTWWGRTYTGQSIFLDHVIEEIYKSLNTIY